MVIKITDVYCRVCFYSSDVVCPVVFRDFSILYCQTEHCRAGGIIGHSAAVLSTLWWRSPLVKNTLVGHVSLAVQLLQCKRKNSWNGSHNWPLTKYKSEVISCQHMYVSLFTSLLPFTSGLTLGMSQHIIIYCNRIFRSTILMSLLQLVKSE